MREKRRLEETLEAIKGIIDTAYQETTQMLEDNIEILHAIADGLLTREVLDAADIEALAAGKPLPAPKPDPDDAGPPSAPATDKEPDSEPQLGMPGQPAEGFTG